MATFTRLKTGAWGIHSLSPLEPGGTTTITKKDGTTQRLPVGVQIYAGDGVYVYAIGGVRVAKEGTAPYAATRPTYTARKGRPCGYPGCDGKNFCDECSE